MKFSIKDFFNKYDQIRSFLRIWSHASTEVIFNGKLHFLCSAFFSLSTKIQRIKIGSDYDEVRLVSGFLRIHSFAPIIFVYTLIG